MSAPRSMPGGGKERGFFGGGGIEDCLCGGGGKEAGLSGGGGGNRGSGPSPRSGAKGGPSKLRLRVAISIVGGSSFASSSRSACSRVIEVMSTAVLASLPDVVGCEAPASVSDGLGRGTLGASGTISRESSSRTSDVDCGATGISAAASSVRAPSGWGRRRCGSYRPCPPTSGRATPPCGRRPG